MCIATAKDKRSMQSFYFLKISIVVLELMDLWLVTLQSTEIIQTSFQLSVPLSQCFVTFYCDQEIEPRTQLCRQTVTLFSMALFKFYGRKINGLQSETQLRWNNTCFSFQALGTLGKQAFWPPPAHVPECTPLLSPIQVNSCQKIAAVHRDTLSVPIPEKYRPFFHVQCTHHNDEYFSNYINRQRPVSELSQTKRQSWLLHKAFPFRGNHYYSTANSNR